MVSSHSSFGHFARALRESSSSRLAVLFLLMPGLALWTPAYSNPRGGNVVHGVANIGSGAGGNLQIRQNSRNAIIEWDDFSIDAGEMTKFVQPGANAAVLNRVVGGDPSQIHGALQANGNVFVINTNGILVGPSGNIDVHGLVLSTLDVSNGEFLAGGDMVFKGGSDAGVTNMGRINAIGGDVFLMGRTVQNSGEITASGTVGLGAGTEVLLTAGETTTGERLFVRSSGAGASGTGVLNDGSIQGAAVELKAHGNVYALAINNKGSVRATGTATSGGKVFLRGVGGNVSNSGSIEATGPVGGQSGRVLIEAAYAKVDGLLRAEGGSVRISGSDRVEVDATIDVSSSVGNGGDLVVEAPEIEIGATAGFDASGEAGGRVRIGGGFQGGDASIANAESLEVASGAEIRANAAGDGDAGSVILWSDDETSFNGLIEAEAAGNGDGGFVEVSGKEDLLFRGAVSTLSAGGDNGTLLLDPTNFEVIAGGVGAGGMNQISNTDLQDQLALGNVVIATDSAGAEDGTITVETGADLVWSDDNSLAFLAHGDILFNASVQTTGTGNVTAVAGWNGTDGFPGGGPGVNQPASINFQDFVSNPTWYGNASGGATGAVVVGDGTQTAGIAVGSLGGETNVAAGEVVINGGDSSVDSGAQIGFVTTGGSDSTGAINVHALGGGVSLNGGEAEGGFARIGHGGEDADGNSNAAITVASVGNIELASGSGVDSAAQIGHGGTNSDGTLAGDVTVESTAGQVELNSTSGGQRAYTQIGHGGYASKGDKGGDDGMGNLDTISVTAANDVLLRSGGTDQQVYSQNYTYSMIGNGGYDADANNADPTGHRADITVTAGSDGTGTVALQGSGARNGDNTSFGFDRAYTQIGNGGSRTSGDHSGTIQVSAADNVRINNGNDIENYSQIGHGGYDSDALGTGHSGDISVTVVDGNGGSVTVSGTPFGSSDYYNAGRSFAQIGHGGYASNGDHDGNIIVDSDDTFELRGGRPDNGNAQVGHGGQNAQGDFSGSIAVTATNDIDIRGGTNNLTYAQIGHGGYNADGNHTAAFINVISENGSIDLVAGNAGALQLQSTDNLYKYAQIGLGGGLTSGIMSAPISVSANGDIYMEAGGNFFGYSQIGNGGWEAFGDKSGEVSVTSTTGSVSVLAAGRAPDTYSQIGHGGVRVNGTLVDDVTVSAADGIELLGGRREAIGSYAQVGHGGLEAVGNKSGTITIDSDNDGNDTGDLTITGGTAEKAYALVGHGGVAADGFIDGMIGVNVGGDLDVSGGSGATAGLEGTFNFGQIGHSLAGAVGGFNEAGVGFLERDGMIVGEGEFFDENQNWVIRPEGYFPAGWTGSDPPPPATFSGSRGGYFVELPDGQPAGSGQYATNSTSYVLYTFTTTDGGTYRMYPSATGFNGNSDSFYTDIVEVKDGAGGEADWYFFGGGNSGIFSWKTGDAGFEEASTNSGSPATWTLDPNTTYTLRFNPREDGIAVDSWMLVNTSEGASFNPAAGVTFTTASGVSGASDIDVTVGGNINLTGGAYSDGYATIGHGGSSTAGVNLNMQYGTAADGADISVTSTGGNILLDGNSSASAGAERGYASIGHHGIDAGFDAFGSVSVKTEAVGGTVTLTGGSGADNFARIGHGGGGDFADGSATLSGDICVVADGGIAMSSPSTGDRSFTQIGHGGYNLMGDFDGEVTVASESGAVTLAGGTGSTGGQYSQIGHGGAGADGSLSGEVQVLSGGGDLSLTGGDADESYAMIGHGDGTGTSAGTRGGGIEVFTSGALTATNGSGVGSDAFLFHQSGAGLADTDYLGGNAFQLVAANGINVADSSLAGLDTMIAGNIANGPVHVALSNDVDIHLNGDLLGNAFAKNNSDNLVLATGGSIFVNQSYQQAGDGDVVLVAGYDGTGTVSGTPSFNSATCELEITGDSLVLDYNSCEDFGNNDGFIRVGDSSVDGNGDQTQGIAIGSSGGTTEFAAYGLVVAGSDTTDGAYGQIGFRGDATGAIEGHLQAGGLSVQSGQGGFSSAYAQIGHGGSGSSAASLGGDISISFCEPGAVDVLGGSGASSYAQVGHGGEGVDATITGTSSISTSILGGGAVLIAGGTGTDAYAMVGAGGGGSDGTKTNAGVSVEGASVEVRAGSGDNSFSQIGSGGGGNSSNDGASGSVTGNVEVTATTGDVTVSAAGFRAYAQIGNGGAHRNNNVTRTLTGTIDVNAAAGSVVLNGGSGAGIGDSIAQIGHGSFDGNTTVAAGSHITVDALNNVDLNGGSTTFAAAQIGHGGINSRNHTVNDSNIDINQDAGMGSGAVTLDGVGSNAYAQIGHGGARNDGNGNFSTFVGNVTIHRAADISLTSGTSDAYSMIGHGGEGGVGNGSAGSYSGAIKVMTDGAVSLTAGFGNDSYAQIGHGGEFSRADLAGDICVVAGSGVVLDSNTNVGADGYAMVGHGGHSTIGTTYSGDVTVTSLGGGVQLTPRAPGSTSANQFVQVGHGGRDSTANMSGNVTVIAEGGGDITLLGGDLVHNYAMIGHGDSEGATTTGTRQGGVHILADGTLTATSGAGGPNVNLYHQTGDAGGLGTNYLGGDGFDLIGLGGANVDASAIDDISPMIGAGGAQNNLLQGGVNIALNGDSDITFDGFDLSIATSEDLSILTGGDITFLSSYQNDSDGNINLVAGWNGSGFAASVEYPGAPADPDFCEPTIVADGIVDFTNCDTFGSGDTGVVTIGSASQTDATLVGTREGTTSIGGHGLVVQASTTTAGAGSQLGFFGTADDATGDTAIYLHEGGLAVNAGLSQSYAQIGHGGFGSVSGLRQGAIGISFCEAGTVGVFAGTGGSAYAQIGHGGEDVDATLYRGDITIGAHSDGSGPGDVSIEGGDGAQAYAQIGHGGGNGSGSVEGSIDIRSAGAVSLLGGSLDDAYAQIGQGGFSHNANRLGVTGDRIVVIADGGVSLTGGDTIGQASGAPATYGAYAQIGSGGYDADVNLTDGIVTDIYVNYDPDANGGLGAIDGGGDVVLLASTNTTTDPNYGTYAQIGHGGRNQEGAKIGDIVIGEAGNLQVEATLDRSYAQIGHGGNDSSSTSNNGNATGDVSILSSDSISVIGGEDVDAYAQIGHGGLQVAGNFSGDLTLISDGPISLDSGTSNGNYAMVGHGGYDADGTHQGNIYINYDADTMSAVGGGDITLSGRAGGVYTFSQIGHGGRRFNGDITGDIVVGAADAISVTGGGGSTNYSKIGHGGNDDDNTDDNGSASGSIRILESDSVTLEGGTDRYTYAQIGHGGYQLAGDFGAVTDVIEVISSGNILLQGSDNDAYAQIGNGGIFSGGTFGATLTGDELVGGTLVGGNQAGDVFVNAGGNLDLLGGSSSRAYAMVGHGGYGTAANATGTIDVDAGGNLQIQANGTDSYAQVGHGGGKLASGDERFEAATISDSDVFVDVVGNIDVRASTGSSNAYGQIGHGGFANMNTTVVDSDIRINEAMGSGTGTITVAGGFTNAPAMIGHGGARQNGDRGRGSSAASGDIQILRSSGILLEGGAGADGFAKIGHGGEGGNGALSGMVEVHSDGSITLRSGTNNDTFAQIGHGRLEGDGDLDGMICVVAGDGLVLDSNTNTASDAYTMIGHGGDEAQGGTNGTFSGDINVVALNNGVTLTADSGGTSGQFAQIGHGGEGSDADMSGNITVVADNGGDIELTGGGHTDNYAMIGHGDGEGRNSTGTREGGVHIFADGQLTALNGSTSGTVNLYHQTGNAPLSFPGSYLGGDGFQIIGNGGDTIDATAIDDIGAMIAGNAANGPVSVVFNSDMDISFDTTDFAVDTSNDFYIVTGGNIEVLSSYQNEGDGDVFLVAGWDGTGVTFNNYVNYAGGDFCMPEIVEEIDFNFTNCDSFGVGDKTVTIGSAGQTDAVRIGSRSGTTYIGAYGLHLEAGTASNAASQIGFAGNGNGDIDGNIEIYLKGGGLELNARGANSYAQIGHGGIGASRDAIVDANVEISFCEPGDVMLNAGTGSAAYAQIGHGGNDYDAATSGSVSILEAGNVTLAANTGGNSYAMVGHGGNSGSATRSGDLRVETANGSVTLQGSSGGGNSLAQIGHGGRTASGTMTGNITVLANGTDQDVNVFGGTGNEANAMIGHGGTAASGNKGDAGDLVRVEASRDVLLYAGENNNAYAQIGNGGLAAGGTKSGNIQVTAGRNVELIGASSGGDDAYAIIGNGGPQSANNTQGDITVSADNRVLLQAGTLSGGDTPNFAQIGHGGHNNGGTHGVAGNVIDVSGADIDLIGGTGTGSYAQIGMGGYNAGGNLTGDVIVSATGAITLDATTAGGSDSYVQIGNGGSSSGGTGTEFSGTIDVEAASLDLMAGGTPGQYAQVGHGGHAVVANVAAGSSIDVDVLGAIDITGGGNSTHAQIGHGGFNAINLTVEESAIRVNTDMNMGVGAITLTGGAGQNATAQIGHGGARSDGTSGLRSAAGDITIDKSAAITLQAGINAGPDNVDAFVQIGHGGQQAQGDFSGNIEVNSSGDVQLLASSGSDRLYSLIGHGGSRVPGNLSGDITMDVDGNLTLDAGNNSEGFAQIGHGGSNGGTDGNTISSALITVDVGGAAVLDGGNTDSAYAQIGHGGYLWNGDISGGIDFSADSLQLNAENSYAQVGNGGFGSDVGTIADSTIRVDVVDFLDLDGGIGTFDYAQIGHGGAHNGSAAGTNELVVTNSHILINTDAGTGAGDVTLDANGSNGIAQIGHGGARSDSQPNYGQFAGDITIGASSNIILTSAGETDAYTQIGHGGEGGQGNGTAGTVAGAISLTTAGEVSLTGGTGTDTYSQIGHGGDNSRYSTSAASPISIDAGSVSLNGNTGVDSYAQIGHGGSQTIGSNEGAIAVMASTGSISLNGGSGGSNAYAQIGHGGTDSSGDAAGDIFLNVDPTSFAISAGTDILLNGGSAANAYAQVGHGGADGTGSATGSVIGFANGGFSLNGGSVTGTHALFGHGGINWTGDLGESGDVVVAAGLGGMDVAGGTGENTFSQIGFGGIDADGTKTAEVFVNVDPRDGAPLGGGDVTLEGGDGDRAYAQVGHGGIGSEGSATGGITLDSAGDLGLLASGAERSYALIGHGGVEADGFLDGDITLDVTGNVDIAGGGSIGDALDGAMNFAMVGHSLAGARGGFGGIVERDGRIVSEAEYFDSAEWWTVRPEGYFPAGWTGSPAPPPATFSGSRGGFFLEFPDGNSPAGPANASDFAYYTFTTGSEGGTYRLYPSATGFNGNSDSIYLDIVELKDGTGGSVADWYLFAAGGSGVFSWKTGSAGNEQTATTSGSDPVWDLAPDTTYTLRANPREDGVAFDSWMLVNTSEGGSFDANADITFAEVSGIGGADIAVNAGGNINLAGGVNGGSHSAIGHGGSFISTSSGGLSYGSDMDRANVTVISNAGNISLTGGQETGDGGSTAGRYAAIGHHGTDSKFDAFGSVRVEALGGDVTLVGGSGESSGARIGHGGDGIGATQNQSSYSMSGNVDVFSGGGISMSGGSSLGSDDVGGAVQIGHGGLDRAAVIDGAVTVDAIGLIDLVAGDGARAFGQIGHGGINVDGDKTQAVSVSSGSLEMNSGNGTEAHAQIGHGGYLSGGVLGGEVDVEVVGSVNIAGGAGDESFAHIGHGGRQSHGAKSGAVTLQGESIDAEAGAGQYGYVQVGHGGSTSGGDVTDASVSLTATGGPISLSGGSDRGASVQVGHGGWTFVGSVVSQSITVSSATDLTTMGGSGVQSSVHIGHGGLNSNGAEMSGMIAANVGGNLDLLGGTNSFSFAQVGHGGASTDASLDGLVQVDVQGDITMTATADPDGAYSKIGHGDDIVAGPFAGLAGGGSRDGDVEVAAAGSLVMTNAMIGHVNSLGAATATGGVTQIGVSREDPTDPSGGSLIADADSEFSGFEELRFYLPRRGNNEIASGALLNGNSYAGAQTDPSETQGEDEYTIHILGDEVLFPNEHGNVFDSGPAPTNAGGFAFYYDTIVLAEAVDTGETVDSDTGQSLDEPDELVVEPVTRISPFLGFEAFFPDDRLSDDELRERAELFSAYYPFFIYYEGFSQYGYRGESTFSFSGFDSE